MAEVVGIYSYPMTGARELAHDRAMITTAGVWLDRAWVLYDADPALEGKRNRVSRKSAQLPALAQVVTHPDIDPMSPDIRLTHFDSKPLELSFNYDPETDCVVNEFDKPTQLSMPVTWQPSGFSTNSHL